MSKKGLNNQKTIKDISKISNLKKILLGLQHTFTMFGATILVPIITGLNISVSLFLSGVGTLVFHLITKGKVPAFLGSSFAFIAPMLAVLYAKTGITNIQEATLEGQSELLAEGLSYARGGIVVAGIVYLILSILIYFFGINKIIKFFPPIVTGPIIVVIGLKLAPTAVGMASNNYGLAIVSFTIVTVVSVFARGFIQVIPIILGLIGGYIVALATGNVDFSIAAGVNWVGIPPFALPKFDFSSIMIVAPIALATMIEHVGDVLAIGSTVEKDFIKDPGLHRTLAGDGIATLVSAMFGGPSNTTYSENTGVLALTRVWDPKVMRIAAVFAMLLGLSPKIGILINTIPTSVIGGISIVLFGMIASIGARTLVDHKIDFTKPRNLIIAAVIMILGLGDAEFPIRFWVVNFTLESMALAAITGIILNRLLPN